MTNMKRWLICAFLFLICYIILINLDGKKITEGLGGCRGGCGCRGGLGLGMGGFGRGCGLGGYY